MSTELQPFHGYTQQQIDVVKASIFQGASNEELAYFLAFCKGKGIDPFSRQAYAYKQQGKVVFILGIDGLRSIANKTGLYRGRSGPFFSDDGKSWSEVPINPRPMFAKVSVRRQGFDEPVTAVARLDAYDKGGNWAGKLAYHMLGKVAEAHALRAAFPDETGGVYIDEERQVIDQPDASVVLGNVHDMPSLERALDDLGSDCPTWMAEKAYRFLFNQGEPHDYRLFERIFGYKAATEVDGITEEEELKLRQHKAEVEADWQDYRDNSGPELLRQALTVEQVKEVLDQYVELCTTAGRPVQKTLLKHSADAVKRIEQEYPDLDTKAIKDVIKDLWAQAENRK